MVPPVSDLYKLQNQPQEIIDAVFHYFGHNTPIIEKYVDELATSGVERGLIGPREVPRIWSRHVLNSVALSEVIDPHMSMADVGSGAGLPGLVVAIARPDLDMTLIEPMLRRTTWLEDVIKNLGISHVHVSRGRAEEFRKDINVDVVTARAVTALKNLLDLSIPLLKSEPSSQGDKKPKPHYRGKILALKGAHVDQEIKDASKKLNTYEASAQSITVGQDHLTQPTTIAEIII